MRATVTLCGERGGGGKALCAIDRELALGFAERRRQVRHQEPAHALCWFDHHHSQLVVGGDACGVLHVAQRPRSILHVARDHGVVALEHFATPDDVHRRSRSHDMARGARQPFIHAA